MGKKLLLHSCCGPCSTAVIERLKEDYEVTVFFYNPNIMNREEYEKRKESQMKVVKAYGLPIVEGDYDHESFLEKIKGYENEPEGGTRCEMCFALRLNATAELAVSQDFDYFSTTLSVSPHKDYGKISSIGSEFERKWGRNFLKEDFKKKAGFQRSIELSKELELYRQRFCGCEFSK